MKKIYNKDYKNILFKEKTMSVLDRFFKKNEENQSRDPEKSQEIKEKMTNLRDRISGQYHGDHHKPKGGRLDGVPYGSSHVAEIEEALNNNDGKNLMK